MLLAIGDDPRNVRHDPLSNLVASDQCLFDRVKLTNNSLSVDTSVEDGAVENLQTLQQHAGNDWI